MLTAGGGVGVGFVGVTGLAGAGKTTAVGHLIKLTGGHGIYLGQTVLDEVRARGLPETRENERQVRIDLRQKGPEALAIPYVDKVTECLENGISVFVDAILTQAEFDLLTSHVPSGSARLLAIEASFDVRSRRLKSRQERPLTPDELRKRDNTELERLGTRAVIESANCTIHNEETLGEFYRQLAAFVSCCG